MTFDFLEGGLLTSGMWGKTDCGGRSELIGLALMSEFVGN